MKNFSKIKKNWIPDKIGNDKQRAFTLVELLVVIVIIGILGSVITASLGGARKQARDTKRVADVKNIAQALEQYYTDKGVYPVINNGSQNSDTGICIESSTDFQNLLIPGFLAAIPIDPLYNTTDCTSDLNPNCHCYIYRTQGASAKTKEYKIFSKAETTSTAATSESGTYYFEAASPTGTAAAMTPGPSSSVGGNWLGGSTTVVNFSRSSNAYGIAGGLVATGVPRYESGKFGQAIFIEEGTTNYSNHSGPWASNAYGYAATITDVSSTVGLTAPKPLEKTWQCAFDTRNSQWCGWEGGYNTGAVAIGDKISVSGYYKVPSDCPQTTEYFRVVKSDWSATISDQASFNLVKDNTWHYFSMTVTINQASTTSTLADAFSIGYITWAGSYYFNGLQLERKPYSTSWTDATRNSEGLNFSTTNTVNIAEGTIEFWWKPTQPYAGMIDQNHSPALFSLGDYTANASLVLWAMFNYEGTAGTEPMLRLYVNSAPGAFVNWTLNQKVRSSGDNWYQQNIWTHIALTWTSGQNFNVYVNGVKYGPYASSQAFGSGWASSIFKLGECDGSSIRGDAYFDDLRISNRARTDAEILSDYQSSQPLPVDNNATYKLGFDGSLQ